MHTSLAGARGITGAAGGGVGVGDQFVNLGGPSAHVFDQPTEVLEEGVRVLGQAHAAAVAGLEGLLKNGEEAYGGRDGKCHGAQFTKDLLPLAESNATLVGADRVQDVADPDETMRWEGDRLVKGVDNPPQDGFERGPSGISLSHLFDRCWLLAEGRV
jgi:hypothetical protein